MFSITCIIAIEHELEGQTKYESSYQVHVQGWHSAGY